MSIPSGAFPHPDRDPHKFTRPEQIVRDYSFDPPDVWSDSELERIVRGCEQATDDFVAAVNRYNEVDARYQRAWGAEYARLRINGESSAGAERLAQIKAIDETIARRAAENLMESAKSLMRTRLAVLSAKQSDMRAVSAQT